MSWSAKKFFVAASIGGAVLIAMGIDSPARAANKTWVGATANFNTAGNWNASGVPAAADVLFFGAAGAGGTTLNNDIAAGLSIGGLTYNTGAAAFTINGNALVFGGNIADAAANNEIINLATSTTAVRTVTLTGGGQLILNGIVSGAAGGFTLAGTSGTLVLNGANTYTGATTTAATGSLLQLGNASAVATSALTVGANNTVLFNSNAGAITTFNIGALTTPTAGVGNIALADGGNAITISVGVNNANTTYSAVLSGAGGFTKVGTGTQTLSGLNTYTGITTITAGTISTGTTGILPTSTQASSIGNVSNVAANLVLNGGTLQYLNSSTTATSTDHLFTLTTLGGGIDSSGGGALSWLGNGVGAANSIALSGSGARTFTLTGSNTGANSFTPIIGDNGGATALTKAGAGTWTLNSVNSYTGITTVAAGTLVAGVSGALPTNTPYVVNGGTLNLNNFGLTMSSLTGTGGTISLGSAPLIIASGTGFAGAITGTGSVNITGAVTLTGADTFTGGTTVQSGVTLTGNTASLIGNIVNNGTVAFNQATNGIFAGNISGAAGSVTVVGSGVVIFNGTNTFGGGTTVNGGTLQGTTTTLQGNISIGANLTFAQDSNGTYTPNLTGSGTLTKIGAGTLTLSGSTAGYTGASILNGGTLNITNSFASTGAQFAGGTLALANGAIGADFSTGVGVAINGGGTLDASGVTTGTVKLGNIARNSGGALNIIRPTGGGTVTTASTFHTLGTAIYSGSLVVDSSNWAVTTSGTVVPFSAYTNDTWGGSTTDTTVTTNSLVTDSTTDSLRFNAAAANTVTLSGVNTIGTGGILIGSGVGSNASAINGADSNAVLTSGSGELIINQFNSGNFTIGAVITGTALTKAGPGTTFLTGTNTYSSGTNLSGGTLSVSSDANLGDPNGAINFLGGTLQITGTGLKSLATTHVLNLTTFNGGYDIADPGNTFTVASSLSGPGALTKAGAGTLVLTGTNTYTGGTLISAGTLQGTTTSLSNNITDNSNLTFSQTANGTFLGQISGTGSLTKSNTGTVTLGAPVNTYTGSTIAAAGGLTITGSLASPNLVLAGGTFTVNNPLNANGVNFSSGTALNRGSSSFVATNITGTAALGLLTHNAGSSVNFTLPTATGTITTTSANSAGTILGGFATVAGANWAISAGDGVNAGAITPLGTYAADTFGAGLDTDVTASSAGASTNSVRFNTAASTTVTLSGPTVISSGGILETATVGNNSTTITGGSLAGAAGGDLIIHQFNSTGANSAMTINSNIVDNGGATGLVKTGNGTVLLTGNLNYTGNTTVGAGTLTIGTGGPTGSLANSSSIVTNGTLAFNHSDNLTFGTSISGSGGLTQSGTGTITLNRANTYTGTTTVNSSTVTLDFTAGTAPTSNILSSGSSLAMNGATFAIKGGLSGAVNSQTFAGLAVGSGLNTLSIDSGTGTVNIALGSLTRTVNSGSMLRIVPPASGTIFASTTPGAGVIYQGVVLAGNAVIQGANRFGQKQSYATYGLNDYAVVNTATGQILPGDAIPGFWTTGSPTANNNNEAFDMQTSAATSGGVRGPLVMRFNTPAATTYTIGANPQILPNVLVTPNMGAVNALVVKTGSGVLMAGRNNGGDNSEGYSAWQNNTLGYLTYNIEMGERNDIAAAGASYAQAGAGTVVLANLAGNTFTGQVFLNEGYTVINSNLSLGGAANLAVTSSSTASNSVTVSAIPNGFGVGVSILGQTVTAVNGTTLTLSGNANATISASTTVGWNRALNLSGGRLVANASFALATSGTGPANRAVNLNGVGGALAATTGTTLAVPGLISGTGALTIGTSTIAGSGPGTANLTPVIGDGIVSITGANTFTGGTTVANGTLLASNTTGSATGTGAVTINSGAILGGNGFITGPVNVSSGGHLAPGTSNGTITIGGLNTVSGSILDLELSTASNDLIVSNNGLNFATGTGVNLFQTGSTSSYGINGLYTMFNVPTGTIPSPSSLNSNLTILNPLAGGNYNWDVSGTSVTLTISGLANAASWIHNGGGSWADGSNWSAAVPTNPGDSATFGNATTSGTANVLLNGDKAVGTLSFNNTAASYSIDTGSGGSLHFNNNAQTVAVTNAGGSHAITADVVLDSDSNISVTNAADSLTFSGAISGSKTLNVSGGSGKVILAGSNSYGNTTIGAGATLQVGSGGTSGTLGAGATTMNGTLNSNRSDAYSLNGVITGSGTLVQSGLGTTTLGGVGNSGTWSTSVSNGKLLLGTGSGIGSGTLTMSGGTLDLNGNAASVSALNGTAGVIDNSSATPLTLTINQNGVINPNISYSGTITNSGTGALSVIKAGSGNMTLSGTGTYSGNTVLTGGTLTVNSSTALQAGTTLETQVLSGLFFGNVTVPANVLLTIPAGTGTSMFDVNANSHAVITGNISSVNTGGGTQTRINAGNNPATTDLTITGNVSTTTGLDILEHGSWFFAGTSNFTAANTAGTAISGAVGFGRFAGTTAFVMKDSAQLNAASLVLAQGGVTTPQTTFTIQDNASVNLGGSANLVPSGTGNFDLNAAGTTNIVNFNGGTVRVGALLKSNTGGTTNVNFNGTQFIAGQASSSFIPAVTAANVQSGGFKINTNGFEVGTVQALAHDPALGITPDGGLIKSGAGKFDVQTQETYTGPTTITGGSLVLQGSNFINTTNLVNLAGGTLNTQLQSNTFTAPLLVSAANSGIDLGFLSSFETLTFGDSSTQNWAPSNTGPILRISNWSGGANGDHIVFNTLNGLTAAEANLVHFTGFRGLATTQAFQGTSTELVPATNNQLLRGDLDHSGGYNANDLDELFKALTNQTAFEQAWNGPGGSPLTDYELPDVADVNQDGVVNNADIQAEIYTIQFSQLPPAPSPGLGGGSNLAAVPEPSSIVLLGLALPALGVAMRRRRNAAHRTAA